jgi:hypothetical protein
MTLPSVSDLNALSCSQNALLLLRVLGTSDLSWMCDLFSDASRLDVVRVCSDLLALDGPDAGLSDAEREEFASLLALVSAGL